MALRHPRNLLIAAFAALAACGSSSGGDTGTMSVRLVDGPTPEYDAVKLDVRSVSIHSGADGWITLGTPNKVINLLALTGGVAETLAEGATLPAGHYDQMRLLLGPDNSVVLSSDHTEHALKVPSGMQSGVKLNVSFDVAPNTTKDVFIDFDAHRSVFVHETGSGKYLLRPVVRAVDKLVTGAILGTLRASNLTHDPLPGVTVTAQVVSDGAPAVVRSVTTGADGSYVLDLLPIDGTYYVASQPVVGATAYEAAASHAITLTAANPTPTEDLSFDLATQVGSLGGSITPLPGATESDVVSLRQALDVGTLTPQSLIVRVAAASFAAGVETYAFESLPYATYGAVVTRQGEDASGNPVSASGAPVSVIVASPSTVLPLSAP